MPGLVVRFGSWIPFLAVLVGGEYEYHGDEAWIEPMEDCLASPLPALDKEHPIVQGLTKIIRHLADTIGDRAIIAPVPWMLPRMFEESVMPDLRRLTEYLDSGL
jgi:hypothetical protein